MVIFIIDKILLCIAGGLILFLLIFFMVLFYYICRYKNSNLFTDKGQKSIGEIPNEEVLDILNKFTLTFLSAKTDIFEKSINKWNNEYVTIFFANYFRLSIEERNLSELFTKENEHNIMRIARALVSINEEVLSNKFLETYNEDKTNTLDNETLTSIFMWDKYPLKTALINYIRNNVEKFT